VEVILSEHPLKSVKQELLSHGLCKEMPIEYLSEEAVAEYLSVRFPGNRFPAMLARLIHQHTEGNPLFMVNMVDYLTDERMIVEGDGGWQLRVALADVELGVPENIRHLIEKQIDRLSREEQRVLEAASVVGMSCSAVAIAAALDGDVVEVEECGERLARRDQFLLPPQLVELPDGTITPRFKFIHILYLNVLYNRIALSKRAQMHRRISKSGEEIYGDRVGEIAAELAVHFDEGRDWNRAVKYHLLAAENASRRFANYEAVALARRGLELVNLLPEAAERGQQEIALRLILGSSLMTIKGFADMEAEKVYEPARELCERQGASPQMFKVLWSLGLCYLFRARMRTAREISEQLVRQAHGLQDPPLVLEAHLALGVTLVSLGEFAAALEHLDLASSIYDSAPQDSYFLLTGNDARVVSHCFAAWALWSLGHVDRSLARMDEALARAQEISHTQSMVAALYFAAQLHQLRREAPLCGQRAGTAVALAKEHGLELWGALSATYGGWAEAEQGEVEDGIARMRAGLASYRSTGAALWRTHFLGLLAEASAKAGRLAEGLSVLDEALATTQDTGASYYEAELYRLRGELLMRAEGASGPASGVEAPEATEAKACFEQAIAVARRQRARSWELRATMSLARLYAREGERIKARQLLADTCGWFTEGTGLPDLKEARALLDELS
jgi:predicted ATPase